MNTFLYFACFTTLLFCVFFELRICHFHHYAHKKHKIKHMIIMGHGCHHMVFEESKKGHRILMHDHCHHDEHHHHHDSHHEDHHHHHHEDHHGHHRRRNDLRRSWSKNINETRGLMKDLDKWNNADSSKLQVLKDKLSSRKSKRRSSTKNRGSSRRYSSSLHSDYKNGRRTLENADVSFDRKTNTTQYYWPKKRRSFFGLRS